MRESTDDHWLKHTLFASLPSQIDVLAIPGYIMGVAVALFTPVAQGVVARALVGIPLLFFVPGYALVSALFPGRPAPDAGRRNRHVVGGSTLRDRGVDWRERLALSVGASVSLQPLLAVVISLSGFAYTLDVLVATLGGVAVLGMVVAVVRRRRLPVDRRFQVPYDRWIADVDRGLFVQRSRLDAALNVVLAVVVLASLAGVGYAVVAPNNAESYTSATVLTENNQGELVAGGYPDTIDESGGRFVLRLANHEGTGTSYTVVGELQRVRSTGSSVGVVERREVVRTSTSIAAGDAWTYPHDVEPALAGEELRLIYYVYRGGAPADPSVDSAYRYVHVWVDAPAAG